MDVGDDTSTGNGGLNKRVKLLVAADGELQVTRSDSLHLEVFASVASELENLSSEVLEDGGRIDGGCSTDAAACANSTLEEPVDSSDRELDNKIGKLRFVNLIDDERLT